MRKNTTKKPKELTPIQEAYNRNRNRLKGYIKEFEKIGYEVEFELPKTPKKITEGSVRKLKNITKKIFREKHLGSLTVKEENDGRILEGKEARQYEKQIRKQIRESKKEAKKSSKKEKPQTTPIVESNPPLQIFSVYDNIRSRLMDFPSGKWVQGRNGKPMYYEFNTNTNILLSILNDNMSVTGYEEYLLEKEEPIMAEFDSIVYRESTQEQCDYSFVTLANVLDYGRLYMDRDGTAEELSNMNDYYSLFDIQ